MGRKRALGDDASSEDDFLPSDASASPPSSRLKRKRRASTRSRVSSRSNDQSDDARQQPQVICIPESPEEEDVVLTSVQELSPVVDGVKEVPNSEEQSQVENCGDKEGGEEGEGGEGEGRDGDSIEEMIGNDEDGDRMAGARDDASAENSVGEPRRRPDTDYNANPSSFDEINNSEPESEDDKDEAYDSCDDSPDEDDEESDFAPSPVRVSRKTKQGSQKRASAPAKKSVPARALKSTKTTSASGGAVGSKANLKDDLTCTDTPKKTLGARIRTGVSSLSKMIPEGVQRHPKGLASGRLHTVYRAGLSRNAATPRLHSYLK